MDPCPSANLSVMRIISTFLLLLAMAALPGSLDAQQNTPMETPRWVTMMEDPQVNYFEAVKAFEEHWKTNPRPSSEAETFETQAEGGRASEAELRQRDAERVARLGQPLSGAELERAEYLKHQSKRFTQWMREVKPWVQEDGRILSYEERTAIWQQQQEEIRKQEKK